ncbi:YqiA/YcfP family alpha/beta fold hydrolase [Sulfurospirillum barnesii]|uniref:Putative esterase n=1 Tax=Sulfurospirillum barnesii (strain ATCC 700032 / DSM 10660 / SES-3) TaxID=760154 RepID=I3XTW0_SULBS|nr:YqiA/YcfP family alpha/beta fold hydrolase [Sulfurospirillum barnesii]AFL67384.1 putative esterase [Sulfurospirillum barnesii SES-3]
MIIYIHGFGSSGEASKAKLLRAYCQENKIRFIAPSLPTIPDLAIKTLSELIESYQDSEPVYLIGASLGGYYALYLGDKYALKTVLINPAINAPETLERAIGHGVNYYDNSSYEWNESHLEMLESYEIEEPNVENILLLLQKGDEVLDYEEALDVLEGAKLILEEGGTHGFEGLERHFESIKRFLGVALTL